MKKNLIIISFIMILLLSGFTTGIQIKSTSSVFYVDDDNIVGPWIGTPEYPFRFIQDAVENASNGDIIRVFAGIYDNPNNNVYITKKLNVIGNGSTDTFIERLISISADNVVISGFTIKGYDYETLKETCCIKLENSNNCDIGNNTIISGLCCIELYNSHNNNIENNIIVERVEDKPGIYLFSSNNNIIRKNHIDSSHFGVYIDNSQYNLISLNNFTKDGTAITLLSSNNNTICGNVINEQGDGLNVISSNYNTFIDNNIINNFDGLILRYSNFNNIIRNNISKNINSIYVYGANNSILGNNISNNLRGLSLGDYFLGFYSHCNIVSGNNISSNNESGIRIGGSHNIISNNTISHNDDGILLQYHLIWTLNSSNNYNITDNTIIFNRGNGIKLFNCSYYTITGNNISNNENGISIYGSQGTTIRSNIISSNNNTGMYLHPCITGYAGGSMHHFPFINNRVIRNLISDNGENGIVLSTDFEYRSKSRDNLILENNFINNKKDAFIRNAFLNRWHRNYWNGSIFLPKIIFGVIQRDYDTIEHPWFNVDWRPSLKSYNILGFHLQERSKIV